MSTLTGADQNGGCFFVGKTDARLAPGAGHPLIGDESSVRSRNWNEE